VGPYFFEEGGVTVTVTSNRYCEMLENFLRPKMEKYKDADAFWFQQDGATAHTTRHSRFRLGDGAIRFRRLGGLLGRVMDKSLDMTRVSVIVSVTVEFFIHVRG